jgi:hypothetical protein
MESRRLDKMVLLNTKTNKKAGQIYINIHKNEFDKLVFNSENMTTIKVTDFGMVFNFPSKKLQKQIDDDIII